MLDRSVKSDRLERCLLPRCDDVPSDAALGQVVERREALCEQEWGLERGRGCDAKGEVLGHRRHGGDGLVLELHTMLTRSKYWNRC